MSLFDDYSPPSEGPPPNSALGVLVEAVKALGPATTLDQISERTGWPLWLVEYRLTSLGLKYPTLAGKLIQQSPAGGAGANPEGSRE